MPKNINALLIEKGFKMNGYDYYKSITYTDLESDWEEEVYIFNTQKGFEVYYPQREKQNKRYKSISGLKKFISKYF